jgi:hypothetical protein
VDQALAAWGAARSRDASTGEIDHAIAVLLVARDGRIRYRVNGNPVRLRELLPEL